MHPMQMAEALSTAYSSNNAERCRYLQSCSWLLALFPYWVLVLLLLGAGAGASACAVLVPMRCFPHLVVTPRPASNSLVPLHLAGLLLLLLVAGAAYATGRNSREPEVSGCAGLSEPKVAGDTVAPEGGLAA